MKTNLLLITILLFSFAAKAQLVTNGPELDNDKDMKMNRTINADENSFYTYRVRAKGRGTSYFVEKFDKATLKPAFTKEIEMEEDRYTKVEDVKFAGDNIYIFIRQYNKKEEKMSLNYRTVSSAGVVSPKMQELLSVKTDHYEFIDFDIFTSPSAKKFLVKTSFKASNKDAYKTHFTFFDVSTMKKTSEKTVHEQLFAPIMRESALQEFSNKDVDLVGLTVDDEDNIYYAYVYFTDNSTIRLVHYRLAVGILLASAESPKIVEMNFEDDYKVSDVLLQKNSATNELLVAAYYNEMVQRKGKDLESVGLFSVKINLADNKIKSKSIKL